ncbi:type I-E CRISPR-associated protein Cas7/Cse4/CasC [Streptacidiphilus neutrinimicus]|uniref:type I-E CRISPR-associated protein Cas7/Cse4/CasC n=1 Tax=Streptacidiphilus neutrinimicus TaxID=105420 RepID=UPI0005A9E667|nr:type I-E CRISPR-associated protein Cas7/Cse4/CasC [Streptacidiphilus neutrinimicus]
MSVFLDLNAVQSVPAANLNRDDLGSPKSVRYGNAPRIRVSSQSWKRVIRHGVEQDLGEKAARSRLVPLKVRAALIGQGWPEELAVFAGERVMAAAGKKGIGIEKEGHSSVLLFVPETAIAELAALCGEFRDDLEKALTKRNPGPVLPGERVEAVLKQRTVSIALLGRMLAEVPGANVDGAAQVAHAFTTHPSEPQRDYFTAVDDWLGEAETGSGHLDTAEFSAGVFYRYATVNVTDLLAHLEGDAQATRTALASFAGQFILSLPQAKRNSTAPHTLPDLVHLAVRRHRPVSLAAAFETPVTADNNGGFSAPSRAALDDYATRINRLLGTDNTAFLGHAAVHDDKPTGLGAAHDSYTALVDAAVATALAETATAEAGQ